MRTSRPTTNQPSTTTFDVIIVGGDRPIVHSSRGSGPKSKLKPIIRGSIMDTAPEWRAALTMMGLGVAAGAAGWPRYMVEWRAQPRRPRCRPGQNRWKSSPLGLSRTPRHAGRIAIGLAEGSVAD